MTRPKYLQSGECPTCHGPRVQVNGAWLRDLRMAKGVTLRALAKQLGYSTPYLSDIERGNRCCTPAILQAYEAL